MGKDEEHNWLNPPTIFAKLEHPESGYPSNVEDAKQLEAGRYYEVEHVSMGQSHTNIFLKDVKGIFSSVQFEFFDKERYPIDIFEMPEFNPYLNMFRGEHHDQ